MSNAFGNLDRLDRKLLFALDQNSRMSFADLGRMLRVPPETARYRLNSLVERGVISTFLTLIDSGKLGNTYYKILLKLYNVNETQVLSIIDSLVAHDAVNWVARTDGIFDIAFTIRIRKIVELSNFLDALKQKYLQVILKVDFAVNIEVEFAVRDFLIAEKRTTSSVTYTSPLVEVAPDDLDLEILRALANNTRLPAATIAHSAKVSTETILQRIRRLERGGIITRYTILPCLEKLGVVNYYVLLYLSKASFERIQEFRNYCRNDIHILYTIKALGEWDYELNIEVSSLHQYRETMMRLTKAFSDIIRDYQSLPVAALYKFTITP